MSLEVIRHYSTGSLVLILSEHIKSQIKLKVIPLLKLKYLISNESIKEKLGPFIGLEWALFVGA